MNCPNCGKSNPPQAQACGNCGHLLRATVFPSVLPSAPPEALSAAYPSRASASTSQKPGCMGSLLKRVLAMLTASIVGWLCGLVNAALLPAFAQTQDSAWLVTLTLSGGQMCLSFVIALGISLVINRGRRAAA
ncbi:MAG: zinc ribbon domain-containing protein [Anaerolineales bacterium]